MSQSSFGKQADRQRLAWTLKVLLGAAIIVGVAVAFGAALTGNDESPPPDNRQRSSKP